MSLLQFKDVLDTSCKYKVVATHDKLVLVYLYRYIIEMVHLYQSSALNLKEFGISQCLADELIVGRHEHLDGIVVGILKTVFGSLAVGQKLTHGDDRQDADEQAEQSRYSGGKHIYGVAGMFGV